MKNQYPRPASLVYVVDMVDEEAARSRASSAFRFFVTTFVVAVIGIYFLISLAGCATSAVDLPTRWELSHELAAVACEGNDHIYCETLERIELCGGNGDGDQCTNALVTDVKTLEACRAETVPGSISPRCAELFR